ncbi:MAG: hypothetical protein IJ545_05765 [Alphaproteobacteria bacterium]|nr:hypothetical protein [Alphaproteobacteria bacterium]
MLNNFKTYLLNQNYKPLTAEDYKGRIERLLAKEKFTLEHLVKNITSILPEYERNGKKHAYGKRSHSSVLNALRRFSEFLAEGTN